MMALFTLDVAVDFAHFCFMGNLLKIVGACTLALLLAGCHSLRNGDDDQKPVGASTKWFLDPSVEFGNYRSYGFLQVTAARYVDAEEPKQKVKRRWFGLGRDEKKKELEVHHTDEIIWRTLQEEMMHKGYAEETATAADLWVVYYGGPRPVSNPASLNIEPSTFDRYFTQNELTPQTFFVDVIDAKTRTLIYRGWDNGTFSQRDPAPERVVEATRKAASFFPSKR